jgi:hypothetical protein
MLMYVSQRATSVKKENRPGSGCRLGRPVFLSFPYLFSFPCLAVTSPPPVVVKPARCAAPQHTWRQAAWPRNYASEYSECGAVGICRRQRCAAAGSGRRRRQAASGDGGRPPRSELAAESNNLSGKYLPPLLNVNYSQGRI